MTKICSKCHYEKPVKVFSKDASNAKDGLCRLCKACSAAYAAKYYEAHRAQIIVASSEWYKNHLEQRKTRAAAHYQDNSEKEKAIRAAHYEANRERIKAGVSTRRRAHPEQENTFQHRKRARKRMAPGSHTTAQWLALVAIFGGACAYCHEAKPLERDHIVPLSGGGSNDISNIVPACKSCNSSKSATPLLLWLVRRVAA